MIFFLYVLVFFLFFECFLELFKICRSDKKDEFLLEDDYELIKFEVYGEISDCNVVEEGGYYDKCVYCGKKILYVMLFLYEVVCEG